MNKTIAVVLMLGGVALAGARLLKANQENAMDNETRSSQDQELRQKLSPEQYHVVRENGTERPFQNAHWDNHREGIYVDVVSGEPLFSSRDKFDSGTGWPSFSAPLEKDNVVDRVDRSHGMTRTEVRSRGGDCHLGHVFPDGPAPTGRRFCINSAALRFIPVDRLEAEGYGRYLPLFGQASRVPTEKAVFAAGCFWGVESAFADVNGVLSTRVGYTGGTAKNPTYKQVCGGGTGHAKAVEVTFDPARVSYGRLLEIFWKIHDPTTPNRQGVDVGTQYRSAIFYENETQAGAARASRDALAKTTARPVVTEIAAAGAFYPAEEYHQGYNKKHGYASCRVR